MSTQFHFRLARTSSEFETALRLLQYTRECYGLEAAPKDQPFWLLKHHALPATNTLVALEGDEVVAALCLFGDSPFRLPAEARQDLRAFRKNLDGRLAELSLPALDPRYLDNRALLFGLYHFAICFGTSYCNYDGFLTEAPSMWAREEAGALGFARVFEPVDSRHILYLDARKAIDFRAGTGNDFRADYEFPQKKFFLVAHQNMCPSVLNYLFNERTHLFDSLTDSDLRVLRNVYDWGDYARLLPSRPIDLPAKKTPRFPRFPMNCEGYLVNEHGGREPVQLLDVSREGLKIRIQQAPDAGASYVLTLFVGVNRTTELIANAVWVDPKASIAGLEVRSSDAAWSQLVDYLEKDFLRVG